ncbi:MAG: hypothetical protein PHW10_01065 [Candidatus Peribacteraceae bacterium]|nr:hypothetical protein [Candidatus Peribacteraceae bacterium]
MRRILPACRPSVSGSDREKRLLGMAPADPRRPLPPETTEQLRQAPSAPASPNPVGSVLEQTRLQITGTMPLALDVRTQNPLMDTLEESGTLDAETKRIAAAALPSSPARPAGNRSLDAILNAMDPAGVLRSLQSFEGKLDRYVELIARTEKNRHRLEELGCDRPRLEPVLHAISQYEAQGNMLGIDLSLKLVHPANVLERLGVPQPERFTQEQRERAFQMLVDITQTQRIRSAFGQPAGGKEIGERARNEARERFLLDLGGAVEKMRAHLDAKINERATTLLQKTESAWSRLQQDTFRAYNLTADGTEDAFREILLRLHGIRRDEGYPRHRSGAKGADFLPEAEEALRLLDLTEKELRTKGNHELPVGAMEELAEENAAEQWASQTAIEVAKIDLETLDPDVRQSIEQLQELLAPWIEGRAPTPDERADIRRTRNDEMRTISKNIQILQQSPRLLTSEGIRQAEAMQRKNVTDPAVMQKQKETRQKLDTLLPGLLYTIETMRHPICDLLGLSGRIRGRKAEIDMAIGGGEIGKAEEEIRELERCKEHLGLLADRDPDIVVRLSTKEEFKTVTGRDDFPGYYSYGDGRIYLNMALIRERGLSVDEIVEHERGHAVIDAFRRFNVFPNLLTGLGATLERHGREAGHDLTSLLLERAEEWGIPVEHPSAPSETERWKLIDELLNRTAEWQRRGRPDVPANERALFEVAENLRHGRMEKPQPLRLTGGVFTTEGADGTLQEPGPTEGERPVEPTSVDDKMTSLRRDLLHVEAFLDAYPSVEGYGDMRAFLNEHFHYDKVRSFIRDELEPPFAAGQVDAPEFLEGLEHARNALRDTAKFMGQVDQAMADLSTVQKTGQQTLFQHLQNDIAWVSLWDMYTMFKDMKEDIIRMWKRRGESARNKLGKGLTQLIPDEVIYLGRLKHEFERRDRTSEEEEVSVWEKGWEKIDSHILLHEYAQRVRTPDQLKAIINLLTKRGRMDWENKHIWQKLQEFSGYKMPELPCRRNTILRNQWLQKMIASVWRDKDLYEHWKTGNDGAIAKGKSSFTPFLDDISAIKNEAKELKKLLVRHQLIKDGKMELSAEEEVNPHLYEEILHYAMRNGKMSMEDKFFYLIKGVESGLLSLDRLRAFPGETMKILGAFPFIDFFTRNHNTHHEIEQIAHQITEDDDPYSPGPRMTRFLMEQVAFDPEVVTRVSKTLKGGQNFDHEDIPMIVSMVDWQGIDNLANVYSGSQWKLSTQGMENGYVGYNTFFQYLRMKMKAGKPITQRERQRLCTVVGAYVMWDNIVTQFTNRANAQRPYLSWEQIKNDIPVSGKFATIVYRKAASNFVHTLSKKLGIDSVEGIPIDDFVDPDRNEQSFDRIRGKESPDSIQKKWFGAPEKLVNALKAKIAEHPEAVLEALNESAFFPEQDNFDEAHAQPIFDDAQKLAGLRKKLYGSAA